MYNGLVHAHSGLRWLALIVLVIALVNAMMKWQGGKAFTDGDRKINLYALIAVHIQLILGLVLYFISPKVNFEVENFMADKVYRFYMVEHIAVMIIAIALITIGYARAKNAVSDELKFKRTFWFYLAGLLLILSRIPWPGMGYGTGWF